MRIGGSLDNNTLTVLTKPSQTCLRMLHAGCSGLGLRCTTLPILSFAGSGVFNQIIHLFLLSTFRRARHWGCPPKRQPLPPPSRRGATPPARTSRPPETKDSVTADFRGGFFQVAGRASRSLESRHFGQSRRLAAGVNNHSSLDTSSSLKVHF